MSDANEDIQIATNHLLDIITNYARLNTWETDINYEVTDLHYFLKEHNILALYLFYLDGKSFLTTDSTNRGILSSAKRILIFLKPTESVSSFHELIEKLTVISLPNDDSNTDNISIQNLSSMISSGIGSYFEVLEKQGIFDMFSQSILEGIKLKISKLNFDILNLKNNVEVPSLISILPSNIQTIITSTSDLKPSDDLVNQIQKVANEWIRNVNFVINQEDNQSIYSINEEIAFWGTRKMILTNIKTQIESPETDKLVHVLQTNKRTHTAIALTSTASLKRELKRASVYSDFLNNLHEDSILTAKNITQLQDAIEAWFVNFKRLKSLKYSPQRAIHILQLLINNFEIKAIEIITQNNLIQINSTEFNLVFDSFDTQMVMIDSDVRASVNLIREELRKQNNMFVPLKIELPEHIKDTLISLKELRGMNEDLQSTIAAMLTADSSFSDLHSFKQIEAEVRNTYEWLKNLDFTELFHEPNSVNSVKATYSKKIIKIEEMLAETFRSIWNTDKNDPDVLFKKFEKFSSILAKPHIRLLLHDFVSILFTTVERDIVDIESRCQTVNEIETILSIKGIPKFSSKLYLFQEIVLAVRNLTTRLEAVLSRDWASYPEGKMFSVKLNNILNEIKIDKFVAEWIKETSQRLTSSTFNLPLITYELSPKVYEKFYVTKINNDMQLWREIECLEQLCLKVPGNIKKYANKMKFLYLKSLSMEESLSHFYGILDMMPVLEMFQILTMEKRDSIFQILDQLKCHSWLDVLREEESSNISDDTPVLNIMEKFFDCVFDFSNDICFLRTVYQEFSALLDELTKCPYEEAEISTAVTNIQLCIVQISDRKLSNHMMFLDAINKNLCSILTSKCQLELNNHFEIGYNKLKHQKTHELLLENMSVIVTPDLHETKEQCINMLNRIVLVSSMQNPITLANFSLKQKTYPINFNDVLVRTVYQNCLDSILIGYDSAIEFVQNWKHLQLLWNFDCKSLKVENGDSLSKWLTFFIDLAKLRQNLNLSQKFCTFGSFRIDYEQIQYLVFNQLNTFETQITYRFAELFQKQLKQLVEKMKILRMTCQRTHFDLNNSDSILLSISNLFDCQSLLNENNNLIKNLNDSFVVLSRASYYEKNMFIDYEGLQEELRHIEDFIKLNLAHLETNMDYIKTVVSRESNAVEEKMKLSRKAWNEEKPILDVEVHSAMLILENYSAIFSELVQTAEKIEKASILTKNSYKADLSKELHEILSLKSVWKLVLETQDLIFNLRRQEWKSCSLGEIKQSLENEIVKYSSLSNDVKNYPFLRQTIQSVNKLLKEQPLLLNIANAMLDDSHWVEIFESLSLNSLPATLTVGDICDLNLLNNEWLIKSVISKAQSEQLIDRSILDIETFWKLKKPEVYSQTAGVDLLTGWEPLLTKIDDDLATLDSITASTYSNKFDNRIHLLYSKLQHLSSILSMLYEIQRHWVYLLGVFSNKDELVKLMPLEVSRFETVSNEIKTLLSSVVRGSSIFGALEIPEIDVTTNRIHEFLTLIKSSLIGYLDKQRQKFPRFYFIGNDDLLELMGNPFDIFVINKHIKKLYTGIMMVEYNENTMLITSVTSSEGEVVELDNPVSFAQNNELISWLLSLELSLKSALTIQVTKLYKLIRKSEFIFDVSTLSRLISEYSDDAIFISFQRFWTSEIENTILQGTVDHTFEKATKLLTALIEITKNNLKPLIRLKVENLIVETIHKADILQRLKVNEPKTLDNSIWFLEQKFYFSLDCNSSILDIKVVQGSYSTTYSFEYLGVVKKLAYTPLMISTYTLLAEAVQQGLGGLLLGPAGTGKTESVKHLGHSFGRLVFVFCCDDTFDYESVSRIMMGIAKLGGWGCFDEFNRLNSDVLSGITTQIERIQTELIVSRDRSHFPEDTYLVHRNTGIFLTNNPSYDGRSTLPDNLKSRFLSYNLIVPDLKIIANVVFASQGFSNPKRLADSLVSFFLNMQANCSAQNYYDFGLRALKSVVTHCGKLNRQYDHLKISEDDILCQGLFDVVFPRLISSDESVFHQELKRLKQEIQPLHESGSFKTEVLKVANEQGLASSKDWMSKSEQIYQLTTLNHGTIIVGNASVGKSAIFSCVIEAILRLRQIQNEVHRIDVKTLSKESVFGELDYATREWRDGILCSILRRSTQSNITKQVWIVFDGDIDPKWVENLNSLLDDNKVLTLPNGERIPINENVRIIFETESLQHATPATISRCGIILLNKNYYTVVDVLNKFMFDTKYVKLLDEDLLDRKLILSGYSTNDLKSSMLNAVFHVLDKSTLVGLQELTHQFKFVVGMNFVKAMNKFKTLTCSNLSTLLSFIKNGNNVDFNNIHLYFQKNIPLNLIWSFASELSFDDRVVFTSRMLEFPKIRELCGGILPLDLIYSCVPLPGHEYHNLKHDVKTLTIQPHMISSANVIIPTVDTVTYEALLYAILEQSTPIILCGPPGSGKTMLLLKLIRESSRFELLNLNFSKETTIKSLIRAIEQSCQYRKNPDSYILSPKIPGKSLVLFCDELNLPKCDQYGTQKVIQFLRQIVGQKGFWHPIERVWVSLQNIQFVGACNPISVFGRINMTERFTNLCFTIMIDYPSPDSLKTIYETYCKAVLKMIPDLVDYYEPLCQSMINVYLRFKEQYSLTDKPHYICTPRELTRWVRGISVGLKSKITMSLQELLRLWAYEGLRLFSDRLITSTEKNWVFSVLVETSKMFFPNLNTDEAFRSPILFSDWLSIDYQSVNKNQLMEFVRERFNIFSQEETNLNIVLYEELLDHLLRIDRIFKNVQGHMVLVGPNGSGKTTLAKFVSWMNGINSYQLNVKKDYTLGDFESCLKDILMRTAVKGEKTCFIIDESTILENSFLEKMNTLLANAEVPGLYEDEEYDELMNVCHKTAQAEGLVLNSKDEIYQWFVDRTAKNLHVIFTMSDPYSSKIQPFIASSALFNRCVINWMGPWSKNATKTVTVVLTKQLPLDDSEYKYITEEEHDVGLREAVVNILTKIHETVEDIFDYPLAPSQIILLIKTFKSLFIEKETQLRTLNSHIHKGLDHLKETFLKVKRLEKVLNEKEAELRTEDDKARKLLDKMITDQNESERKQDMSIKMQELFADQENAIVKRRKKVMFELQEVEELIQEAQRGVLNIKKQHLTELRSMHNPPETIKLILESICVMLGFNVSTWRDVQHVVRQDDFIASIINFNSEEQVTNELLEHMTVAYLSKDNFNYEAANRASKACGPLLMWVKAQLKFSSIVVKVKPLKKELRKLENDLLDTKAKLIAINSMITDLKQEIETYKIQYSETIRIKENIKIEMEHVVTKLNRSVKLMKSLKSERERWELNVQEYEEHKQWLIGDSILLAAFVTYCGFLLPHNRKKVMNIWKKLLEKYCIHFDPNINWLHMPGIVTTDSIIRWQKHGLPHDEQFIGNTVILTSQFKTRFSYIIDPSNTFIDFLIQLLAPKQIVISSFLDPELYKKLENCLKFGGTIVIQDGEHYDPILNRLIAKDYYTLGVGRMVVRLLDKEIDMSPEFQLYISTKDPNVMVPPFVFARMDVINYTYTTESMVNEALNIALQIRNPDVDAKRLELVNTVNDWKLQLRNYETELLQLLSASEDTILDNDQLLTQLEVVKEKTIFLEQQMMESDKMMKTYSDIRDVFTPLAEKYAKVQKVLNNLESLQSFYLFPINYVKDIYNSCFKDNLTTSVDQLQKEFTARIYKNTAVSLLLKDRIVLHKALDKIVSIEDTTEMDIEETIRVNCCIIMRSGVGQDLTLKVKELALSVGVRVNNFALGARDGHATASKLVKSAVSEPAWIVIENIETSSDFLDLVPDILKYVEAEERHADFKLIMTCGMESNIPSLVVKSCKQILVDREMSLRKCMRDQLIVESSLMNINNFVNTKPKEILKIMFSLVWLYALIVSRLRYGGYGFKKKYEVNEHDLRSAGKFVMECLKGHTTTTEISAELLETIGFVVSKLIFGGKIEEVDDVTLVEKCAAKLFNIGMFTDSFNMMCLCDEELAAPVGYNSIDYVRWIEKLPDPEPLQWLGLPVEAVDAVKVDEGEIESLSCCLLEDN